MKALMYVVVVLFGVDILSSKIVYAQIDTSLKNFFPLHIGDYWEYEESFGDRYSVRITGDTLMENGRLYFVFTYDSGDREFCRIDDSMRVLCYTRDSTNCAQKEYLSYDLMTSDSTIWHLCLYDSLYFAYVGFLTNSFEFYQLLNLSAFTKTFIGAYIDQFTGDTVFSLMFYPKTKLAKGLGLVWSQAEAAPAYYLVGAIIDSIMYGTVSSIDRRCAHSFELDEMPIQSYPTPFNAMTRLRYELEERSHTTLTITNALGQIVSVLVDQTQESGNHEVMWNPVNLPTGLYFFTIRSGGRVRFGKTILLK